MYGPMALCQLLHTARHDPELASVALHDFFMFTTAFQIVIANFMITLQIFNMTRPDNFCDKVTQIVQMMQSLLHYNSWKYRNCCIQCTSS